MYILYTLSFSSGEERHGSMSKEFQNSIERKEYRV